VLQPGHTAKTVSASGGALQTRDGAYGSEGYPSLSGFFIIDVTDADEAARWASRAPASCRGAVEVRPVR